MNCMSKDIPIVLITHDDSVARQAARSIHILDGKLSEVTL